MATTGLGNLPSKHLLQNKELDTKGNKHDSEDEQQNLPWPLNITPTCNGRLTWELTIIERNKQKR